MENTHPESEKGGPMFQLNGQLKQKIDEYHQRCKELSDYLTDNPEIGGEEGKALAAYKKLLEEEGFVVEAPYCGVPYSFLAVKAERVNDTGPKAALMCEYDALAGVGHACGHSMSGASSVLAALALHSAYPDLPVRVDLIGTPGEEYPGGKVQLTDNGAFNGYEYAAMAHMFSHNSPCFNVLACNDRYITFKGKNAHASANPSEGANALNAARLYMDAMDMWRQHMPRFSQIHGIVEKCGELPSIVPDNVELNYYFRAATMADLDRLCEISEKCCKAAALATECSYTAVQRFYTYADLYNTPTGGGLLEDIFEAMGEPYSYSPTPQGSSDAGNVDYVLPVFHPLVNASAGEEVPIHSPAFEKLMKSESGYKGLRNAAILLAHLVYDLGTNQERLGDVREEHRKYRKL